MHSTLLLPPMHQACPRTCAPYMPASNLGSIAWIFISKNRHNWSELCAAANRALEGGIDNWAAGPAIEWLGNQQRRHLGNENEITLIYWRIYVRISSNWKKLEPPYMGKHCMKCYSLTRNSRNSDTMTMSRRNTDIVGGVMSDNGWQCKFADNMITMHTTTPRLIWNNFFGKGYNLIHGSALSDKYSF